MQFSFVETPDSRTATTTPPTLTLQYRATGEQDDSLVHAYAISATPGALFRPTGTLYRQDIQIEPDGWANYIVTVPYATSARDVGSVTFNFDTTGATVHIKAAKQHVATYASSGVVAGNFYGGSIGVKADGEVDGVEIVVPALRLTYGVKQPQGIVSENYAKQIASITGTTNLNPFRGFAGGELLFVGASGSDGSDAEAEVSYQFIGSSNTSTLRIGQIQNIVKQGHHYAWVEFADEVDGGEGFRRPNRVHIERVYDPVDFASVLGWG